MVINKNWKNHKKYLVGGNRLTEKQKDKQTNIDRNIITAYITQGKSDVTIPYSPTSKWIV